MLNITNPSIAQHLTQAQRAHATGQLAEAEKHYRRVLAFDPKNAVALNGMSALAIQAQRHDVAVELARRALASKHDFSEAHGHLAIALAAQGKNDEAIAAYARAIEIDPRLPTHHHNLALVLKQMGRRDEAIAAFRRAIEIDPLYAKAYSGLGTALKESGSPTALEDAAAEYRRAISIKPDYAEGHYNLGVALAEQRKVDEAIECFRAALKLQPSFVEALNNLAAQCLLRPGEKEVNEAIECFEKSLSVRPNQMDAYIGLGAALMRKRALGAAQKTFNAAIKINPQYAKAHFGLAVAHREAGEYPEAIDACREALKLEPAWLEARSTLAMLYASAGRRDEALAAFNEALELAPDSRELQFQRDAIEGRPVKNAPLGYVESFFEDFAPFFEFHLVDHLHYRGPEHLRDAIAQIAHPAPQSLDVLDLGCGTGLCGTLFVPWARRLEGVDLSAAMVRIAKTRGIYTDIRRSDLVSALREGAGRYDLILAGDVFIYVGDLQETFAAAHQALRPGGLLAFTAERAEGSGFVLHPTLRFAHSREYLESTAKKHGLTCIHCEEKPLRNESKSPVLAYIMVLKNQG